MRLSAKARHDMMRHAHAMRMATGSKRWKLIFYALGYGSEMRDIRRLLKKNRD